MVAPRDAGIAFVRISSLRTLLVVVVTVSWKTRSPAKWFVVIVVAFFLSLCLFYFILNLIISDIFHFSTARFSISCGKIQFAVVRPKNLNGIQKLYWIVVAYWLISFYDMQKYLSLYLAKFSVCLIKSSYKPGFCNVRLRVPYTRSLNYVGVCRGNRMQYSTRSLCKPLCR